MLDETKKVVEETTNGVSTENQQEQVSTEENKPSSQVDSTQNEQNGSTQKTNENEEQVTLSAKEVETLRKKAEDFERSIELKRIAKLQKKEDGNKKEFNEDGNEILQQIKEEGEKILSEIKVATVQTQNQILRDVYNEFISEHNWANKDDVFNKLSDNFNPGASTSKEELLAKLKSVANNLYPVEYAQAIENKIAAQHFAKQKNIDTGDMGGGSSIPTQNIEDKNVLTPEQIEMAKRCGNDPKVVYTKDN